MRSVQDNLHTIQTRIDNACLRSNRAAHEITLIAVTKYISLERMVEANQTGLRHFGENRIQDAKPKLPLFNEGITWHFIGHLQSNKVKEVISSFHYIHSLDRSRLVNEIARIGDKLEIRPKCFIQVNVSGEESKQGIEPNGLMKLAKETSEAGIIDVVGLMTMAPMTEHVEETRPVFRKLKELQLQLMEKDWHGIQPAFLSMGMSNDFEVAIEEGATHIRIGTALVGE